MDQADSDRNGINQSPRTENTLIGIKHFYDINSSSSIVIDYSYINANIFGGIISSSSYRPIRSNSTILFEDGDVRKRYLGDAGAVTEIVSLKRDEITLNYTKLLGETSNFVFKQSFAKQVQDSWYEGNDYFHFDETHFTDLQFNKQLNDHHYFTIGFDYKNEILRSASYEFYHIKGMNKDDFDYNSKALYLRDIYSPNFKTELSMAIRLNYITTNWTDQTDQSNEIDEFLPTPRLHLKYSHENGVISRLSYGQGYRAPLTFFESEHGMLNDGFNLDVKNLEKSQSYTYNLSYDSERVTFNSGLSHTQLKNMAYIDDTASIVTLTNYERELNINTFDITGAYQVNNYLNIGLSYEKFIYDDSYKRLLFLAAVEERVKLDIEYETDYMQFNLITSWIGSRNLNEYGYENRYNVNDGSVVSVRKDSFAPSFFVTDFKVTTKNRKVNYYLGAKNLFDFTQNESPLYYDKDGNFDVGHIWGPLRGRQLYTGINSTF